jgi:hypothetical protein
MVYALNEHKNMRNKKGEATKRRVSEKEKKNSWLGSAHNESFL